MPKKITDESLADVAEKQPVDESLADETAPETEDGAGPEEWDFAEWLDGLAPLTATYPLPNGKTFILQARTRDWLRENGLLLAEGEEVRDDLAARMVAAHIVKPSGVTAERVAKMAETPGYMPIIVELAELCMLLDFRPQQITPRFLRGASD